MLKLTSANTVRARPAAARTTQKMGPRNCPRRKHELRLRTKTAIAACMGSERDALELLCHDKRTALAAHTTTCCYELRLHGKLIKRLELIKRTALGSTHNYVLLRTALARQL